MKGVPTVLAFEGRLYRLDDEACVSPDDLVVISARKACTCPRNPRSAEEMAVLRANPTHLPGCPRFVSGVGIRPGACVELAPTVKPPRPAGILRRPPRVGDRGRVVRLVHHYIEGEPIESDEAPTLVQVLFEGQDHVIAFEASELRVLGSEQLS